MATAKQQRSKESIETFLNDETVSDNEMDRLMADHIAEIDDLLQEAYDEIGRGEGEPMEPLHVLLAEERARFAARNSKS